MAKDGVMPTTEQASLIYIETNIRDERFCARLMQEGPKRRANTLKKRLGDLLGRDCRQGLLAHTHARALVLTIMDKTFSGLSEEECREEAYDVSMSFLRKHPMKHLPDAKREFLTAVVDAWLNTSTSLKAFNTRTLRLADFDGETLDVIHNLVRHSTMSHAFFTEALAVLQDVPEDDPRWPGASKLVKALNFNRFANMSEDGLDCFADLADCLDRAPSFVREELLIISEQYRHLNGLEGLLLEFLEQDAVVNHLDLSNVMKRVELSQRPRGLGLVIDFVFVNHSASLAEWCHRLAHESLPEVLNLRAVSTQADKYMGVVDIRIRCVEEDGEDRLLACNELT